MKLEDQHRDPAYIDDDVENIFKTHFLGNLKGSPPFVRLESKDFVTTQHIPQYSNRFPAEMNKPGQRCTDLISKTASSLSSSVVRLMLLAVQKVNLELNINYAVEWLVPIHNRMRVK
jgi:hypothetical protein